MSVLDLNALNELPKVERILALAETNAQLEKLDAEGRVAWALEISQAAGKVLLREAARPAITYPENLPVSQKKQEILEAWG